VTEFESGFDPSAEPLRAGFVLRSGRYTIAQTLGIGGFGVTYQAWDHQLEIPVALKEFFPSGAYRVGDSVRFTGTQQGMAFDEALKDFVREARLLARLRHPNIVALFDHFEELGTGFMVMEFLSGKTYADIVKDYGPLSEDDTLTVLRAVGEGLSAVHRSSLVHRDVKPSNVMGTHDRGVVLIDFGASRVWSTATASVSRAMVSDGFSPLEQYTGHALTPASDVYALAATGLYLATGRIPQPSTARASGLSDLGLEADGKVSQRFAQAIEAAMALRVQDRPQSVAEFLELLTRPVVTEPMPVMPITTVQAPLRPVPGETTASFVTSGTSKSTKPRMFVGAALLVAVAGTAVGATTLLGRDGSTGQTQRAETVLDSTPSAGAQAQSDATSVDVLIDSTPPTTVRETVVPDTTQAPTTSSTVEVPNLDGNEQSAAVEALIRRGLKVSVSTATSSDTKAGYVLRSDPSGGEIVRRGETISLVVSSGAPPAPPAQRAPAQPSPELPTPEEPFSNSGSSGAEWFDSPQQFVRLYYDLVNRGDLESGWGYLTNSYQAASGGWPAYVDFWTGRTFDIARFGPCSWSSCTFYDARGGKVVLYITSLPEGLRISGDALRPPR
jgi:serine/threonine protein kinase